MAENLKGNENNKKVNIFSHINRFDLILALIGTFIGVSLITILSVNYDSAFLIASFGASAVILYTTPKSPFARPQNVICGHVLAAITGIVMYKVFGITWWSLALTVTIANGIMIITNTIHPPAGATSLIAILTKASPIFIIKPVLVGTIILVVWAILMNKIHDKIKNHRNKVEEEKAV
ncbi:HPP family protein [Clostridium cylindrosporum]|uniref:HPP family protein n=1 Tax=Clostridium cylindrosporum DSM 605 TaxID=1121307 RepID=A0A0J8DF11_CLOCY|nr:HPP family protein [Clostridium cylindrosporum]KMT22849.1 HPP family protein [Clostridium cylindrosporum DSM 605]